MCENNKQIMEINNINEINDQLIYKILDKKYESIILRINNVNALDEINNLNALDDYYHLNQYYYYLKHNFQRNLLLLEKFKNALKFNNSYVKILIYNKKLYMQPDFIKFIFNLLSKCKNITDLSIKKSSLIDFAINDNNIIKELSNVIKNSSLKKLSLEDNNLVNVNPIFEILKENNTLEYINLSYNRIGDISILIDVLQYNNTIKIINLSNNNIYIPILDKLVKRYPNIKFIF